MRRPSLLQALDYADPENLGGASRAALSLGGELAARGWAVSVFAGRKDGPPVAARGGVTLVRFPSAPSDERVARQLPAFLLGSFRALGATPNGPLDLVLGHQPFATWVVRRRAGRVPLAYYFHSPWAAEFAARARLRGRRVPPHKLALRLLAERWALGAARLIFVASEFMRRQLAAFHPGTRQARKIRLLPHGVDTERFAPCADAAALRRRLGLPAGATILLTVRRLEERMGLEELLRAFALCRGALRDGLLLIVGRGRRERALKDLAGALGLGASARFWGYARDEDLPDLYNAADVFVVPTQALEGFGLVILEALAANVPVVATPVGGIPEVLGELGPELLARDCSPEALAERIERVLRDSGRAARGDRYRRFVLERYSWGRCAEEFAAHVRALIRR